MALEPITRQEKIIAGQDLTPITRMEKFLKQYGGGSGGVTSWNDLTDKPFGDNADGTVYPMSGKYVEGMGYVEESLVKITWDGDTSGLESMYGRYYKVSDVALTVSQLIGGSITQQNADGTFTTVAIDENNAISTGGVVAVYIESGTASLMSATVDNSGGLEPGLWFYTPGSGIYTSSVSYFGETIHPIDQKFLPSGGGGGVTIVDMTEDGMTSPVDILAKVKAGEMVIVRCHEVDDHAGTFYHWYYPASVEEGYDRVMFVHNSWLNGPMIISYTISSNTLSFFEES